VNHASNRRKQLYAFFIEPRSEGLDLRRRELILNILVTAIGVTAIIAFTVTLLHHLNPHVQHDASFITTFIFLLVVMALWRLSRHGHAVVAAYIFVFFLALAATHFTFTWGFGLTAAELLYALVIVVAGVLLSARAALIITGVVAVIILSLGYAQVHHAFKPNLDWMHKENVGIGDAIGYVAVFSIIGLVTWLANREIDRSLERAQRSEKALQLERDNLEIKVAERTSDLEQAQLVRTMELERFAEFGRLSAHLLHEVSNPLTAASLGLEQLHHKSKPELIKEIQRSMYDLERYVEAARKQLQGQATTADFSIKSEIEQVMRMLAPLAQKSFVSVSVQMHSPGKLYGDAVKFSQLVANLILNAIEAYPPATRASGREVKVEVHRKDGAVVMTISDFGNGITSKHLQHLFEPFYTTKKPRVDDPNARRGLGIGLMMVKQFVEEDFRGEISVSSKPKSGTCFTVILHSSERNDVNP
jgi:signal transduction histidine kinase